MRCVRWWQCSRPLSSPPHRACPAADGVRRGVPAPRSVPLGPLRVVSAGRTAGRFVEGVHAQARLRHFGTVGPLVSAVLIWDVGAAWYNVTNLLLLWFVDEVTVCAVLIVCCETPYLPGLKSLPTRARARTPVGSEPLRAARLCLTGLHGGRLSQARTLVGRRHVEVVPQFLNADDVAALRAVPTGNAALPPGPGVPQVSGHTGPSIAGLHVGRLLCRAASSSFSLSPASSGQTHHLPPLDSGATLCRAYV